MRALVYGGTHHLGAHVVADLRAFGHAVDVLDVGDPVETPEIDDPVEAVPTQLIPRKDLARVAEFPFDFSPSDYDVLVFCGLEVFPDSIDAGISDERLAAERTILQRLLGEGPRAVVLTSSAGVYAKPAAPGLLAESAALDAGTRHGRHEIALEDDVARFADASGAGAFVLRTAIVAGSSPRIAGDRRIQRIAEMIPGLSVTSVEYPVVTLTVPTDVSEPGPWMRDFIHVSDAAVAHRLAAEGLAAGQPGRTLNVGTGVSLSVAEVLAIAPGAKGVVLDSNPRAGTDDFPASALCCDEAHAALGWAPLAESMDSVVGELEFARESALAPKKMDLRTRVGHEYVTSVLTADHLVICGLLVAYDPRRVLSAERLTFFINGESYPVRALPLRGVSIPGTVLRLIPYRVTIPRADLEVLGLNNSIRLVFVGADGRWFDRRITYSGLRRTPARRRSRLFELHDGASTLYIRQSEANRMVLTMRGHSFTDSRAVRAMVRTARWAANIAPRPLVLLYEKESAGYEESASVLFEELIDRGRTDVRFILDEAQVERVPERCRRFVVRRFSWEHFYLFFGARTFIGTESLPHAAEMRTADRRLMNRISGQKYRYVFLQHGVMYMVALSSSRRSFFRAGNVFPPQTKIVCSSQLEAQHFIDLGGFKQDDLYVCGMPKFDRAVLDPGADQILISPTWRPWEHNEVRINPTEAPYYRMLLDLYESVPVELRAKTWLMPHRLVREALADTELSDRIWQGASYDEVLRTGALMITDYSSISYDSFYRGANILFWWKEKDACMEQYGAHLMLKEETAFGPVFRDTAALRQGILEAYKAPQDAEYVRRYREIVEFHDGHNTQRLIEFLERDNYI